MEATCFEERNVLEMTSFTGGSTVGRTAVYFYFSEIVHGSIYWGFKVELHTTDGVGGKIFLLLI